MTRPLGSLSILRAQLQRVLEFEAMKFVIAVDQAASGRQKHGRPVRVLRWIELAMEFGR
jgi:hypothetical protein